MKPFIRIFPLIFFLGVFHSGVSQMSRQNELDSLHFILSSSSSDTVTARISLELSEIWAGSSNDSVIKYCNMSLMAIERASAASDAKNRGRLLMMKAGALNNLGYAYSHMGDQAKGLASYEESLAIRESIGIKEDIANSLNNIAIVFDEQGNPAKALDYYLKSLRLLEETNEKMGMGYILNNIASVYKFMGNYEKALEYYMKSLEVRKEIKFSKGIAESLGNIGTVMLQKGDYNSALSNFEEALQITRQGSSKLALINELLHVAKVYIIQKKHDKALVSLNEGLRLSSESKHKRGIMNCHLALAELELAQNNAAQALEHAKEAHKIATELKHPDVISSSAFMLHNIYKSKNDYRNAYEMHVKYVKMRDSIQSSENRKAFVQKEFQYLYDKKTAADSVRNEGQRKLDAVKHEQEIAKQRSYTYGGLVGFALMLVVAGTSFMAYKNKQKANKEIANQKLLVEEKQKEIVDSITYAKRIQFAMLANSEVFSKNLKEHFILFKPKDIVSGDFYWAAEKKDKIYIAVCDCTGHGVPGAFMSLLNISFLNEAVNERGITEPHEILNHVRRRLIENISQDGAQDGMDAVVVCIDQENGNVSYSAAHNSPVLISNQEVVYLYADKMPVGKGIRNESFILNTLNYKKGDTLYFYTDGYADQFGGPKGKKFKYKQLNSLLLSFNGRSMNEQKYELEKKFHDWKGELEQVDDICIVGIRL